RYRRSDPGRLRQPDRRVRHRLYARQPAGLVRRPGADLGRPRGSRRSSDSVRCGRRRRDLRPLMPLPPENGTSALETLAEQGGQGGAALAPGPGVESVMLRQGIDDAGAFVDVMMIGYSIEGLPGPFYVPLGGDSRGGEPAPAYIRRRKA